MQTYASPIPEPKYDYATDNWKAVDEKYYADLKADLRKKGWNGEHTGKLVHFPWADGGAVYMVAQSVNKSKKMILVHCATGDAWALPAYQTRGLRVSDIMRQLKPNPFGTA